MIKVRISSEVGRKNIIVDENRTIREVLGDNGINYERAITQLDGYDVRGQLDRTFEELGISTECVLSAVAKRDNA